MNYSIKLREGDLFLLERTDPKRYEAIDRTIYEFSGESEIFVPDDNNFYVMSVDMLLNLKGRLAKVFYKIPAVDMQINFADGRTLTKRVIMDNLTADTLINPLPYDSDSFSEFMSGNYSSNRVKSIRFTGRGRSYYSDNAKITFTGKE